jgi:hypothetical protein
MKESINPCRAGTYSSKNQWFEVMELNQSATDTPNNLYICKVALIFFFINVSDSYKLAYFIK